MKRYKGIYPLSRATPPGPNGTLVKNANLGQIEKAALSAISAQRSIKSYAAHKKKKKKKIFFFVPFVPEIIYSLCQGRPDTSTRRDPSRFEIVGILMIPEF